MGSYGTEVSGIVTDCNICCCLFVVCLAPIECCMSLVGIEHYQSCSFVIIHFGHFCVDAPEVGYGDVAMASTALCLTLVTRWSENHVAKESSHEMVLLMMAAKGDGLLILVVFHREVEGFPTVALVAELHIGDSLSSCCHYFIEIHAPHLGAWSAMADDIYREEIIVGLSEKMVQSCNLARSA